MQDVDDTYIPAYQSLVRVNLRSVEEGLYARRLVIARLQSPDDKAEIQRLELATAGKSRDADTELDLARRIIGREISDSRSLEDKPELARLDTRLEFLQSRHRDLETVLTTLEAALCAAATGRRSGSRSRRAKPTTTSLPLTFWHA